MRFYLMQPGYDLLRSVQAGTLPPVVLTGADVRSAFNFVPDDVSFTPAGTLVYNQKNNAAFVKHTIVSQDEVILSIHLDQHLDFPAIGNVVIYANNVPLVWLVSETNMGKQDIDGGRHFSGDEYYFSAVFRYPYIRDLIAFNQNNAFYATFMIVDRIYNVPLAEQSRQEQVFIGSNDLYYGGGRPAIASRIANQGWFGTPILNDYSNPYCIDGGSTLAGT